MKRSSANFTRSQRWTEGQRDGSPSLIASVPGLAVSFSRLSLSARDFFDEVFEPFARLHALGAWCANDCQRSDDFGLRLARYAPAARKLTKNAEDPARWTILAGRAMVAHSSRVQNLALCRHVCGTGARQKLHCRTGQPVIG